MKKTLAIALALATALSLSSCLTREDAGEESTLVSEAAASLLLESEGEAESESEESSEETTQSSSTSYEKKTYSLKEQEAKIKTLGRTKMTALGLQCDFSATGMEFTATLRGDVVLTVMTETQSVEEKKNDDQYFTVFIDGERSPIRHKVTEGRTASLTIATFQTEGTHTIRVLKQSEIKNGLCTLQSLTFSGVLEEAPKAAEHYVEFIGDSITCGYGCLCKNGTSPAGDTDYKDATQAYSYLTARALAADHSLISLSGVAVTKGYRPVLAKQLFEKQSYYRSTSEVFVPARIPDLVVINLGTNDQSKSADTSAFQNDVKALIQSVRSVYGNVPIVWAYGMMKDGYSAQILAAINELGGEQSKLYTVKLSKNTEGGGGHPSADAHKTAAEELTAFIQSKNLLG